MDGLDEVQASTLSSSCPPMWIGLTTGFSIGAICWNTKASLSAVATAAVSGGVLEDCRLSPNRLRSDELNGVDERELAVDPFARVSLRMCSARAISVANQDGISGSK